MFLHLTIKILLSLRKKRSTENLASKNLMKWRLPHVYVRALSTESTMVVRRFRKKNLKKTKKNEKTT